ncbi:MAG: hypothetical protein QNJ92_18285 [Alphaproteobacteria bacterium]|nr:hypothetical protein [Alphaproteobacteria bacterium]
MEFTFLLTQILIVAAIAWSLVQIRSLSQRLESLEKQHMALVAELEDKLYPR